MSPELLLSMAAKVALEQCQQSYITDHAAPGRWLGGVFRGFSGAKLALERVMGKEATANLHKL